MGGWLIILIMLVMSINVTAFGLDRIARNFGVNVSGLSGYEDFVRLTISCAALMFLPYCQLNRGHVVVDIFANMFPKFIDLFLQRVWLLCMTCLALFLGYWMTLGLIETANDNALSPVLGWPEWPFYIPGIISLFLWAAISLSQIGEVE